MGTLNNLNEEQENESYIYSRPPSTTSRKLTPLNQNIVQGHQYNQPVVEKNRKHHQNLN